MEARMTPAEQLIQTLHAAFDYTGDNNRDLVGDPTFNLQEVAEELEVQRSYQFLCAYIARNQEMIDGQLEDS
jgi:hypothetical protein